MQTRFTVLTAFSRQHAKIWATFEFQKLAATREVRTQSSTPNDVLGVLAARTRNAGAGCWLLGFGDKTPRGLVTCRLPWLFFAENEDQQISTALGKSLTSPLDSLCCKKVPDEGWEKVHLVRLFLSKRTERTAPLLV